MKRIAVLSPYPWRAPTFGGEMRVFQIAKHLGADGFKVDVFCEGVEATVALENVKAISWVNMWRNASGLPISLIGLVLAARTVTSVIPSSPIFGKYDVIISELLHMSLPAMTLRGTSRKTIILDEHNIEWNLQRQLGDKAKRDWKALRIYEKLCWKRFDRITVTSFADESILESSGVRTSKVSVVPNGVDLALFHRDDLAGQRIRSQLGLSERPIVLFMGNFGHPPNVDAVKILLDNVHPEARRLIPDIVFLIVGRKSQELRLPVDGSFVVTGLVDDVPSYINAADVCIAPIRFGSGTRMKILEWMACEKAVIATSKAMEGIEVENGHSVIIENDPGAYAAIIKSLVSDRDLSLGIGRNARDLAKRSYDWDICVQPMVSLVESATSGA